MRYWDGVAPRTLSSKYMFVKSKKTIDGIQKYLFDPVDLKNGDGVVHDENLVDENRDSSNNVGWLQEQLQAVRESSFKKGFQEGEKAGYEKAGQLTQPHVQSFVELMGTIRKQEAKILEQSEQFLLNFAFKIAEKILAADEIVNREMNKGKLQDIIRAAIKQFSESSKFTIRLHKNTAQVFDTFKVDILKNLPSHIEVAIVEDPSLKPGDCIIESDRGALDARIEAQVQEIKDAFLVHTTNGHGSKI